MRKLEIVAVMLVLMIMIVLCPVAVYAYQTVSLPIPRSDVITVVMRTPDNGNMYPMVIRVKKGDLVRLRLTSEDVAHGFRINEYEIKEFPIMPGEFTTVEFIAEEAGTFDFFCNIVCSIRHGEMRGQLIVEE